MPSISNSIYINAQPLEVLEFTNDIERWPILFKDYKKSELINKEEAGSFVKLQFALENSQGNSWQSWRIIDKNNLICISEREEPRYPFLFMHLKWLYRPQGEGTEMTWIQDFELDPECPQDVTEGIERMNHHTRENQNHIRQLIEKSN